MLSEQPAADPYGTLATPRSAQWMKNADTWYHLDVGTVTVVMPRRPGTIVEAKIQDVQKELGIWMAICKFTEDKEKKQKPIPLSFVKELTTPLPLLPDVTDDKGTEALLRGIRKKLMGDK